MLAALVASTAIGTTVLLQPSELELSPLRVYVYSNPRGEPALVEAIERATRELEVAVRAEPEWFDYVEHRAEAEIVVYVESLSITDETKREGATTRMGNAVHTTHFMSPAEGFELQAVTEILGRTEVFTGRSRTSEARAASALFAELRDHVEKNDTSREERRVLFRYWAQHPEHLDYARALCEDIERRADALESGVLSVHWSGSTLVVTTRQRTSRFPFNSGRLQDCVPDAECRRQLEQQVADTLSRQTP